LGSMTASSNLSAVRPIIDNYRGMNEPAPWYRFLMSPYRTGEIHSIVSDEVELRAIDWLAARKSRLGTIVSVAMMVPTAIAGFLFLPLANELQFALFGGKAFIALSGLIALVAPVTLAFLLSLAVGRLLVRVRASAWLAAAERSFGVPAERL